MKQTKTAWTFMAVVCVVAGCDSTDEEGASPVGSGESAATQTQDDDDGGSRQLAKGPGAFAPDFADSPDFFTLMEGPVMGSSPHGTMQIWYSANIESLVSLAEFTVPEATTSIKEFDGDSDGTVDGYAVMVKREEGYDPDNGDWYYEMRDPSGEVMAEPAAGANDNCIDCHSAWKKTDYLGGTLFQ